MARAVVLASLFTAAAYAARFAWSQADVYVPLLAQRASIAGGVRHPRPRTGGWASPHVAPTIGTSSRSFPLMAMQDEGEDGWLFTDGDKAITDIQAEEPMRCSRRQALTTYVSCVLMGSPLGSLAATPDLQMPMEVLQQEERTVEDLFTRATPAVVSITRYRQGRPYLDAVEVPEGTGSGFVWDKEGHVVTNYHVVAGASQVEVAVMKDPNEKAVTFNATLVGYNPDKDVAVLQIAKDNASEAESLTPIPIGSSDNLRVGAAALAIGNPFGLDHTLTVGVVSGVGREVMSLSRRPIRNMIQTDASINPGNSGGVLLDSNGKLIGMNTVIFSPSGANVGVGFAVPVDTLKQQVATLIRDGKAIRASLGVTIMPGEQSRGLGVKRGVLVIDVPPDSAAAKGGVRGTSRSQPSAEAELGDVIVQCDGEKVDEETDLFAALGDRKPGDTVKLKVLRNERTDRGTLETEVELSVELQGLEAK